MSTNATAVAYQAMAFFDSLLKKRSPIAPRRGRNVTVVRIHWSVIVPRAPLALPEEVEAYEQKDPEDEHAQIGLDEARLHPTECQAEAAGEVGRQVDQPVYDVLVEEPRDVAQGDGGVPRAVDRPVHHPRVEDVHPAAQRHVRSDDDPLVEFVDVVFVQDEAGEGGEALNDSLGQFGFLEV